ncbi:MAG TPA: CHAD domain-containing protein [Xanthobacteraceae bacterium]|nr:CHAD domain-containing protein [Xanthobacteraceae bacterium]
MIEKDLGAADAAVGDALAGVGHEILADARHALEDRRQSDAEAVHTYRKTMKRWRALLRLLTPFVGEDGQHLRRQARDFAHEFAGARDLQGALDALTDLAAADGLPLTTPVAAIRRRLEEAKRAAESSTLNEERRRRLTTALNAAALALECWPLERIVFSALARELARTYRQTRRAIPKDWARARPEALHELRKKVVAHRYQMELVEPLWPRMTKVWVSEAQRLRDRLGHHHDLEMLKAFAAPDQPAAPWRELILPAMASRQGVHIEEAARLAGRLFAERPKAFAARIEALWESQHRR